VVADRKWLELRFMN